MRKLCVYGFDKVISIEVTAATPEKYTATNNTKEREKNAVEPAENASYFTTPS